jgi:hypothetical protein
MEHSKSFKSSRNNSSPRKAAFAAPQVIMVSIVSFASAFESRAASWERS